MAKTNWQMGDTVQPSDLNQIGQEINDNTTDIQQVSNDLVAHKADKTPHIVPACRVYSSINQKIQHNQNTPVIFDSIRFDNDEIFNISDNTRLTCKTPGIYLVTGHAAITNNSTGVRQVFIRVNNATVIASEIKNALSKGNTPVNISTVYDLNENDYLELVAFQDSGVALEIVSLVNFSPEFSIVRIG